MPNFYYGISDQLTVGLAHNASAEIFQTAGRPRPLPDRRQIGGCAKVYNNLSLDALFSFMRSSTMDIAFHGGLDFVSLATRRRSPPSRREGQDDGRPDHHRVRPVDQHWPHRSATMQQGAISLPVRVGFMATRS